MLLFVLTGPFADEHGTLLLRTLALVRREGVRVLFAGMPQVALRSFWANTTPAMFDWLRYRYVQLRADTRWPRRTGGEGAGRGANNKGRKRRKKWEVESISKLHLLLA